LVQARNLKIGQRILVKNITLRYSPDDGINRRMTGNYPIVNFEGVAFLIPLVLALIVGCLIVGKTGLMPPFIYRAEQPRKFWAWIFALSVVAAYLSVGLYLQTRG
jgi:hypothetical protein